MIQQACRESERRAAQRVPVSTRVEVVYDGRLWPPCTTEDISEGGVRLGASAAPVDSRLRLFVSLPRTGKAPPRTLMLDGQVAWRTLGRTGVRFIAPPVDALAQLRGLIAQQAVAPA